MLQCGECNQPPAACDGECEAIAFEPIGDCVAGDCVYQPLGGYTCPFGCDPPRTTRAPYTLTATIL
jgi:hypothetical protein